MKEELKLLREELRSLKECQTQYVCLSITSAGLIFAYLISEGNILEKTGINPACLIPLVILLPLSCTFYDKATTISRIVGYYQILEKLNLSKYCHDNNNFVGWENALSKLRDYGRDKEKYVKKEKGGIKLWENLKITGKLKYFLIVISIYYKKPSQTYWRIIYSTFFIISVFCFTLELLGPFISYYHNETSLNSVFNENRLSIFLTWIFLVISLHVFGYNLKILFQLEEGFHSYKANRSLWEQILIYKEVLECDSLADKKNNPMDLKNIPTDSLNSLKNSQNSPTDQTKTNNINLKRTLRYIIETIIALLILTLKEETVCNILVSYR
ncbi:MAG: hypothetical protein PHV51_02690 [Methanosarcinaceae archaeon]|nr:hypothetical protein [Methanosarcinaceae archaeon]